MKLHHSIFVSIALIVAGFTGGGLAYAQGDVEPAASVEDPGATKDGVDVDALIDAYNATLESPRSFTAEEREWIKNGVGPKLIEDIHKGYLAIPNADGDEMVVRYRRDGKEHVIESAAKTATRPVAPHVGPFAPEVDKRANFWVPPAASETSREVDAMFNFIMWTCYIFSAIILVLMVWFCIRYRRRPGVRADQSITHNTPLEIAWSVLPTILVAIMFWGGYVTVLDLRTPPPDAMSVNVTALRWDWKFQYDNGVESPREIHVPEHTPIELVMTSTDVIHCLHLPAFRTKSDILPNRYTKIWFNSGEPGIYRIYCTEYCGKLHSDMYAQLVVESQEEYEQWLTETGNWMVDENGELLPPLEIGKLTYDRQGCKTCHSIDGTDGTGPTFKDLWGKTRNFADGTSAVADENYIAQSIRDPHSQIVVEGGKNYGAQMTQFANIPDEQVTGMIAFIQSLKD